MAEVPVAVETSKSCLEIIAIWCDLACCCCCKEQDPSEVYEISKFTCSECCNRISEDIQRISRHGSSHKPKGTVDASKAKLPIIKEEKPVQEPTIIINSYQHDCKFKKSHSY